MKRRKIVGLILLIGTIMYLLASLLALYQNQRVKMEKGMEEALKAYSKKEELDIKELSKDFNLMLEEKADINQMNQQISKYEGSFARMEKNVNHVTDGMAAMEYNLNFLNERMESVENFYKAFYEEVVNRNDIYENQIVDINNSITNIKSDINHLKETISQIENQITENDSKQNENVKTLQQQLEVCKERLTKLEENVLYYRYDEESRSLNVYGHEEGEPENE